MLFTEMGRQSWGWGRAFSVCTEFEMPVGHPWECRADSGLEGPELEETSLVSRRDVLHLNSISMSIVFKNMKSDELT